MLPERVNDVSRVTKAEHAQDTKPEFLILSDTKYLRLAAEPCVSSSAAAILSV